MAEDPKKSAEQAAREAERITKTLNSLKVSFQELASQLGNVKLNVDAEGVASLNAMKDTIEQINQASTENLGIDSSRLDLGISSLENLENIAKRQLALGKMNKDEYDQIVKSVEEKKKKYEYSKQDVEESKKAFENSLMLNKDTFQLGQKLEVINRIKNQNLSVEEKANFRRQFALALMTAMVDKINQIALASLKTALALDDSVRELMKGANFSYKGALDSLMEMAPIAAASGLSIKELTGSMITLKQEFSGFTTLNKDQQNALSATVGQLERMGLAASASAGFLDTATKSLAMSETQATNFLTSLKGFADESGITMQQLSKSIAGSREQIVKFGQDGPRVFKEMSLASKQLGIELNTLFDITERFTTFEGAADAAGKLNAILGGDFINSVDLLTAGLEDPTEAFRILKFGLDESGKSFMDLDNASRRAIAAAAGLSLEQASRIFTMDINTATAAMREQEKTQKDMAKISADMTTIQERLQRAFIAMYPALKPLIEAFAEAADKFSNFMIGVAEFMKKHPSTITALKGFAVAFVFIMSTLAVLATVIMPLLTLFASLKAIGMSLSFVWGGLTKIWGGLSKIYNGIKSAIMAMLPSKKLDIATTESQALAEKKAAAAKNKMAGASKKAGNAAKASAGSMLKMAAAVALIMASIGFAALGVAKLVAAFKGMGDEAKYAAGGILMFGVAIAVVISAVGGMSTGPQGLAVAAAIAVILSFGAAAMLVGKGVQMAGDGIKSFGTNVPLAVEAFKKLSDADLKPWVKMAKTLRSMAKSMILINKYSSVLAKMSATQAGMPSELSAGQPVTIANPRIETMTIKAPEANFSSSGASTKRQETENKQKEIVINLTIDSPIKIDNDVLGKLTSKQTVNIIDSTRSQGLKPALPSQLGSVGVLI